MRYALNKNLVPLKEDELPAPGESLVEIMTKREYVDKYHDLLQDHMLMKNMERIQYCRADLLPNCNIGTFCIPDKKNLLGAATVFGYYMDSEKLLFVDDAHSVEEILDAIQKRPIFDKTLLAHLFFEFLDFLTRDDVEFLQKYDERLTTMEDLILGKKRDINITSIILKYRKELSRLHAYYRQLCNLSETFSENYNHLLSEEDCALFRLYADRLSRLVEHSQELRESALQVKEMYETQLNIRQNEVMSLLTVITAVFMPLTLMVGWYGMNFCGMNELNWRYSYVTFTVISVILIILEIIYFKKKKWFQL